MFHTNLIASLLLLLLLAGSIPAQILLEPKCNGETMGAMFVRLSHQGMSKEDRIELQQRIKNLPCFYTKPASPENRQYTSRFGTWDSVDCANLALTDQSQVASEIAKWRAMNRQAMSLDEARANSPSNRYERAVEGLNNKGIAYACAGIQAGIDSDENVRKSWVLASGIVGSWQQLPLPLDFEPSISSTAEPRLAMVLGLILELQNCRTAPNQTSLAWVRRYDELFQAMITGPIGDFFREQDAQALPSFASLASSAVRQCSSARNNTPVPQPPKPSSKPKVPSTPPRKWGPVK